MNILTGFAILNDRNGKRITYTYDVVDEKGTIQDSNKKKSFVVLDESMKDAIEGLEELVEERMNEE